MAKNRFVDAVKDSIQTNKTGNRYVDAAVSGQKVSSSAPTVRSSVAAAYTQRRQDEQKQEQERKRAAQNKVQMQKLGKQTNRQRLDTGENESQLGYRNYLSYKGVDQREIPWKQMTQRSIDAAKQTTAEAQAAKRGGGSRGGGLRSDGTRYEPKPSIGKTVLNAANRGAGEGFVVPMYETADFLANLIPNAVAGIKGAEDPDSTFTGQLFKPVTDATQRALDYVKGETGASAAIVQEATKGNRAAQLAADIGAGVVGAIPNAALAMMTGGASLGGEIGAALTPQAAGISGTALNAIQKVVNNPSFQLSYLQSLGGAYQDAKEAGASEANAAAAAFISAAANALVEAGGGLETLPGDLKARDLSTFEKAREWLTSALDEGKEEVIQGVISTLTNKAAANSGNPYFSMTDENAVINPARMGKEFGMGTAVGGVLGGAQMLGTEAANRAANRHAGPNTNIDSEITTEVTDPMEFAVRETMKPSKERQAMDQAIEDTANWMLGKEKTAAAEAGTESTRVDTDPAKHTPAEQAVIEEYQAAVDPNLVQFATDVINGTVSNNEKYSLGQVPARTALDIYQETGVDTSGFDTVIEGRMIEHIQKRHGASGKADSSMQNLNDLGRIKYVLDNYDNVESGGTTRAYTTMKENGKPGQAKTVVFEKSVNGTYYVVEAVPDTKARTTYVVSAYMSKDGITKSKALQTANAKSPSVDVQNENANTFVNFTIPNSIPTVKQNQETNFDNDMGAKKSDFAHETKRSRGNTTPDYEAANNVPEAARTDPDYIAVTEAESNHNAKLRLDQDYDGELEELRRKAAWSAEEMSMGRMILDDLRADADASGDYSAYQDWAKVFEAHKQEGGRALQNLAQINRRTGAGIMQEAASILDDGALRKGVDSNAVMNEISEDANRFDAARTSKDVDGLVQLIKDTAAERNTGFRRRKDGTQKQSKYLNWALDRIAGYAKSGKLTGNVDPNLQIDASNIQNPDVAFQFLQDFASTGILNIAADTQKVSTGTKLMALRRSGMLSKLSTVMRNLDSNSGFNIVDTIARDISVPLDMLLSNFTKTRSVAMDYGYLSKAARQGSLDNIAMASLETSLDVNGRGNSGKYASGGMRTFKANGNIVERFLSNLEALQGYEMYVTDEMSKGRTQAGVQEGIDKLYERGKIKASDASLRNAGHQEADYRTFQNDSALANATLKTRDALNALHAGDIGAGDVLMPFAQVPANLADRAIDYSPAGLAKTTGKMVDAISKAKRGEFTAADQAAVVQSLGRNITGTVMIGIAAALAANGLIRVVNPGGEDENKDKAALEKMQGQNGTQWNLTATKRKLEGGDPTWQAGDELISIAFMEPMNAQMTIGALLAEDMEQEGQLTAETALKDSFSGSLAAILDLPMMDTIGDAIDAYNYSSEDRTGDKLLDAGSTLAANEVASLIPNWMKGIRQGLDPYQRDMYSEDDVWGQVADQYQAAFGDRNKLPIKQDCFGHEMTNEGGVRNFLNANVLPGYVTTYKGDELTDEITRLAEETGSNAIYPSRKAPDELTIDGEKIPLSYEEQQQYQKTYGNTDEAIRTGLMESDAYSKLTSEERSKAHQYSEAFAKQTASSAVNKDYDAENWVEELQGKSDAEIVDAILYKTFSSLADSKEYDNKYEGMADLVDRDKLSDAMAITMMPDSMQTAYTDIAKKGGVSVDEWLDMYAYAYPAGKTDKGTQDKGKVRDAALDYINRQRWSDSKKLAAANAIYDYLPNTIMTDASIPYDWTLNLGDSGLAYVESSMSDGQKEDYDKYVKGHLDNDKMKLYLDAYKFKGKARSDYEEDGKTVKYAAKSKVIDYIDSLSGLTNQEKIRIFLGLGYSDKSIPYWWY